MDGGRACNNLPVGADMCCWFDLVNNSTLVKHEHGLLPGSGQDEPRNPHTLKEIIALKALGGLALGGILGVTGLAGLAGLAGAGRKFWIFPYPVMCIFEPLKILYGLPLTTISYHLN